MVGKKKLKNPAYMLGMGQIFLLIGILCSSISRSSPPMTGLSNLIPNESLLDTLQGFAGGLSIPMFASSIYLSLRGLTLRQKGSS
jgi:hypothetical protein